MLLEDILSATRNIAGDRDAAAYRYTDNELVVLMRDVLRGLAIQKVATLAAFAVSVAEGAESLTPEPSDLQGEILATGTALRVLQVAYRERIDAGTMGVTWNSGLEGESTVNQERAYRGMLDEVKGQLDQLIVVSGLELSALRAQ